MSASILQKTRTLWRLGPANLLRVGAYRLLVRTGFYRRRLPIEPPLHGPFFDWSAARATAPPGVDRAAWSALGERVLGGELPAFSHQWHDTGFPPRWHRSMLTGVEIQDPGRHWTRLPDFGLAGGDVKGYWEPARFDGLLMLALGWLCSGRDDLRQGLERWLADWCAHNPGNAGVQWKCGQETGIRAMQTLLASELLQQHGSVRLLPALNALLAQHARRIAPTMLYAVGQDNNHGTSEAAALFTIGSRLAREGGEPLAAQGRRWRAQGRHWLEDRVARLVLPDGSFSQHSTNYHRVLLDTCAFVESMRLRTGEPPFSARFSARLGAATRWLAALTDPASGDAPNLGANDGARLFVLHRRPYRDFRPSVQWAARLFCTAAPLAPGSEQLAWLGLEDMPAAAAPAPPAGPLWPEGGYAKLAAPRAWALLRLPRYRFRPSHADGLHVDFWLDGACVLGDGGSFGYAAPRWQHYFASTASHNTVQFDGRDQMPRISRFLFADWLDAEQVDFKDDGTYARAAYRDAAGARHRRTVTMSPGRCRVVDEVSGFRERAVLRWRLGAAGGAWRSEGQRYTSGAAIIEISASTPASISVCSDGFESLHYAEMTQLTVLEVEVRSAATLTTDITWPA